MVMQRESAWPMVSVADAQAIIAQRTATPLGTERVLSHQSAGRVVAVAVDAPADMPAEARATVDGYALRSSDGDTARRVIAELTAGGTTRVTLGPGDAVRIMTGAPLPPGADAAIMVERTHERDDILTYTGSVRPGDCVLQPGSDMRAGEPVLPVGAVIAPADVGLLTNIGLRWVQVYRRPIVAVLSTGDEVFPYDSDIPYGGVRDSNQPALLAAVTAAGCEAVGMGIVPDDPQLQRERVLHALSRADVVISSGGVSMGTRDFIKPLLAELGTVHFGRIAFKPGKPTMCASVGQTLVYGLPGNPVSSLVSFEVFVRPALRRLQGDAQPERPSIPVVIDHPITPSPDRPEYMRASVAWRDGAWRATTTGAQGSSRLLSLRGANALLHVPAGTAPYAAGATLTALLTDTVTADFR
ncbi:MAG: hypothetical protein RLZZ297_1700 [Chloroflexota bacterium]|jgi:molybdopterin molybdotransferase